MQLLFEAKNKTYSQFIKSNYDFKTNVLFTVQSCLDGTLEDVVWANLADLCWRNVRQ